MRRIFVRFDVDGDGFLTSDQFDRAIFFFRGADSLVETSPSAAASRTIDAGESGIIDDSSSDSVDDDSEDSLHEDDDDGVAEGAQRNAHHVAPVSLDDDEADLLRNIRGEFESPPAAAAGGVHENDEVVVSAVSQKVR